MEKTLRRSRSQKRAIEEAGKRRMAWLWAGLIIAGIVLAWILIPRSGDPTCEVWMGFDASISVPQAEKEKSCRLCFHIVDMGLPTRPQVHLSVYGDECDPLWTARPASAGELYSLIEVLQGWKCRRPGTRPDKFINYSAPEMQVAGQRGRQTVMLLFTDGEVSDMGEMRAAINRLARLKNLAAVWVAGIPVQDRTRRDVEKLFAPLGDKLIVTGDKLDSEVSFGLERLRSLLADDAGADPDKAAEAAKTVKAIKLAIERAYGDGTSA